MKSSILIVAMSLLIFLFACEDIFEKNLGKQDMTILSPPNSYLTEVATITFWWEEVKGVYKYNLQIVSPDFNYIEKPILDTNISSDKFEYTLTPGTYQWRVKAFNNSTETDYVTYSLIIDSTLDLSNQTIIMQTPSDNYITNNMSQYFSWNSIYNADRYYLYVKSPDWDGNLIYSESTVYDSITYAFTQEGSFTWAIMAENTNSHTEIFQRDIIIDTTTPGNPVLNSEYI